MKYFYTEGGNPDPGFIYSITVKQFSQDMWTWCADYEPNDSFNRWHAKYHSLNGVAEYAIVSFEQEEPALMFALKFGGQ